MMALATRWEYMRLSAARRPIAVQTGSSAGKTPRLDLFGI